MAVRIRVLENANRTMQRLGFLKLLCYQVSRTDTSNLPSVGRKLLDTVTSRCRLKLPVSDAIYDYVKKRLTTKNYHELRRQVLEGKEGSEVHLELQDIYLADSSLPSRTGKLVKANWEKYPLFGTSLGLVKRGTYSSLTRSLTVLAVTPKEQLKAFFDLDAANNPMIISDIESIIFLFCYVENDAEVILPLFDNLLSSTTAGFDERDAGDMLSDIFRQIVKSHRSGSVSAEERDHLAILETTARTIEKWKGKSYTGGGAREENTRVRIETFCDMGFFTKPDKDRYRYEVSASLVPFIEHWKRHPDTDDFINSGFFTAVAASRNLEVSRAEENEAIRELVKSGKELQSTLGYSPIVDVALLAGARLLMEASTILEIGRSIEILRNLQKRRPDFVRFTVDRMGKMANVKFIGELAEDES